MRVTFYKLTSRRASYWNALRGKRTVVPGSNMALGRGDLPHDLTQFVVEAATNTGDGFWGSIDQGATFKSTGRKRTKPGRAVIARNRAGLDNAEALTGRHVAAWKTGQSSPVTAELARFDELWRSVPADGRFTVEWPTLTVLEAPCAVDADEVQFRP